MRFYGLMQHATLGERKVSAQIYVHSKVMINDTTAIVGSGNINDRRFVSFSVSVSVSFGFLLVLPILIILFQFER